MDAKTKRNNENNCLKTLEKSAAGIKEIAKEIKKVYEEKGIYYIIRAGTEMIIDYYCYFFCKNKVFKPSRTFTFQGKTYRYFHHMYNTTWRNERAVEVPIVWKIVKNYQGKKILEVGNVLSHYFAVNYDILDKYEKGEKVINQDVVSFQSSKKYDLIVSISTLEHVGWNEKPRDPTKILRAIKNLKRLLLPGGKMVITLPLDDNPKINELLEKGEMRFEKIYCLKRISRDNKWKELDWNNVRDSKYGRPFPNANGLVVGVINSI